MLYRVTPQAEQDLDEIFLYWAQRASLEVADRLIETIMDRFWLLAEHPHVGRASGEIAAEVKCFPAGKYLIYYRESRQAIDILHVFHGARDQGKAFGGAKKRS